MVCWLCTTCVRFSVPCPLYIYIRHNGELHIRNFQAAEQPSSTSLTCDACLTAAKAAVFLAAYNLTYLGYTLSLKSVLSAKEDQIPRFYL